MAALAATAAATAAVGGANTTSAVVAAFNAGQLGFSFSIAGFLITYLAGVAYKLVELGVITPATPVAGASSGALLATALCGGQDGAAFKDTIRRLSSECRARFNCQMTLDDAVRAELDRALPRDAHRRCSGSAWLSVSTGDFPPRPGRSRNELTGEFRSREDLLAAAAASSYIPLWSGKPYHTRFRGRDAYDGFFTNQQPCPPATAKGSSSSSSSYCVRVNSRWPPWGTNGGVGAFFGILGRAARLGTGKPPVLAAAPKGGFAPASPSPDTAKAIATWRQALALGVDLAPGVFSDTGLPISEWEMLLVLPGDDAIIDHTWALGEVDALEWARATGLLDAVAAKRGGGAGGSRSSSGGGGAPPVLPTSSSSAAVKTTTTSSSVSSSSKRTGGDGGLLAVGGSSSGSKAVAAGKKAAAGGGGGAASTRADGSGAFVSASLPRIVLTKGGKGGGVFGAAGGPSFAVQAEAGRVVSQG